MYPHAVGHVDGLLGVVHADVHVDTEDQLLPRHEAERRDEVPVARPGHDPLVLPHCERVGARGPDGEPVLGRRPLGQAP